LYDLPLNSEKNRTLVDSLDPDSYKKSSMEFRQPVVFKDCDPLVMGVVHFPPSSSVRREGTGEGNDSKKTDVYA
jgi:hypothetical protein